MFPRLAVRVIVSATGRILFTCLLIALAVSVCEVPVCAQDSSKPSATRLFEVARPATVMVVTKTVITAKWPKWYFDAARKDEWITRSRAELEAMGITDEDQRYTHYAKVFSDHVLDYLRPSPSESVTLQNEFFVQGSGFVVTPDGYIVTNAHVAQPSGELVKRAASELEWSWISTSVNIMLDSYFEDHASQDVITYLAEAFHTYLRAHLQIDSVDRYSFALTGVGLEGYKTLDQAKPAEPVAIGRQQTANDCAVLKVAGQNMQTLPVGDDSVLKPGDPVYVIGYPGAATWHPVLEGNVAREPTFTAGIISAKKQALAGWDVLQTDADISGGSSGGPALNSSGHVIGLATWGTLEPTRDGGGAVQDVAGMNFLVPATVVKRFLNESGVEPVAGTVGELWGNALDAYEAGNLDGALTIFKQINDISPGHPYVQEYISQVQSSLAEGAGATPAGEPGEIASGAPPAGTPSPSAGTPVWVMILVIVVVLVFGIVIGVKMGRSAPTPPVRIEGASPSAPPEVRVHEPDSLPEGQAPMPNPDATEAAEPSERIEE